MLYSMSMNFVLKQPSNIAQMRAQKEGAYGGYILCYMQKKEKKVLRYAPYHAHPGCKKISSAQAMEKEMILINR